MDPKNCGDIILRGVLAFISGPPPHSFSFPVGHRLYLFFSALGHVSCSIHAHTRVCYLLHFSEQRKIVNCTHSSALYSTTSSMS